LDPLSMVVERAVVDRSGLQGSLDIELRGSTEVTHSVRSPGVVDDKAPGAVCLTTQNIRVVSRQLHRSTVWPGSSE
jgi:hypothetical protein